MSKNAPVVNGPSQAPVIEYKLADNGDITRTDKDSTITVAKYEAESGILRLVKEWPKFRGPVVRYLNDEGKEVKHVLMEGDKLDVPKENEPPAPKKTIEAGDKTPAYVEWLKKYRPNEYKAQYGIIGEGTVTKYRTVKDEKGQTTKEPYEVEATLALRKTHLTEKIEAGTVTSEVE